MSEKKLNKRQIAAETGLSYSTVLRYFNGTAGVSDANAAKIQSYLGKMPLGATSNKRASGCIKIAAAFPSYYSFFWDFASRGFAEKIDKYAAGLNIKSYIIRYAYRDSENFIATINMLEQLGADGYVLMPKISSSTVNRLSEFVLRHPTVFICDTSDSLQALGEVICDYGAEMRKFAALIANYDRGSRKSILLIGLSGSSERSNSMLPVLKDCLSEYRNVKIAGEEMCDSSCPRNLLPSWFARIIAPYVGKINAVFANDGVTDLLCEALEKLDRGVQSNHSPVNNISVFGMDADRGNMAKYHGRFHGIYSRQNISEQAEAAVDILIDNLCGDGKLPKKYIKAFTYNEI